MFRNVLLISSGSILAQVISMASILLISRLYDPSAFGVLGTFSAIVLIVTAFVCGKFDLAAVIETSNGRSALFVVAGLMVTIFIVLISVIGIILVGPHLPHDSVFSILRSYLWMIPIFVLAFGVQLMLTQMMVRRGKFKDIALARVAQAIGAAFLQIALFPLSAIGLILGYIAGFLVSAILLLAQVSKARFYFRVRLSNVFTAVRSRSDFAISASSAALLNIAAIQMPIILCAIYFSAADTGQFALSFRTIGFPASVLGLSLSQVLLHNIQTNIDPESRKAAAKSVYKIVLAISVAPAAYLMLYGPELFSVIFGQSWKESGRISVLLVPYLLSVLLATPFINIYYIYDRGRVILYHTSISLTLRVLAFIIPPHFGYGFEESILCLALVGSIPNAVLFLVSLKLLACEIGTFLLSLFISIAWAACMLMPGLALYAWVEVEGNIYIAMLINAVTITAFVSYNIRLLLSGR